MFIFFDYIILSNLFIYFFYKFCLEVNLKYSLLYLFTMGNIKTSFVLPEDLYLELKKRAAEERRAVKDLLVEAILEYISKPRKRDREKLIELITSSHQGASPEDYKEYDYEDI